MKLDIAFISGRVFSVESGVGRELRKQVHQSQNHL